jgi:hypothetical protein
MEKQRWEVLMAWGRYLYWCDIHHRHFKTCFDEDGGTKEVAEQLDQWRFVALISQWYASLWTVIEGWKEIGFKDALVDSLLDSSPDQCEMLRRFRNAIYHYQPELLEPRMLNFLEAQQAAIWADTLHYEFQRFFDEKLLSIPGKGNQEALRNAALGIIGWLPTDTEAARLRELEELWHQAQSSVGDATTAAAREFLLDITRQLEIGKDALARYRAWRRGRVGLLTQQGTLH